ncbi:hypothetical protein [Clostridium brassicae]|uniref:Plasmid segregation centromere-binding protein ParR n=1 Tax=Clostridium brassicae TaxID=2999072 RepID=A0ABT4D9B1_9CLOT|nr:hypothetical protein [Clostridium brassicae]MCY6958899.1 hypothetical protein [Clostridium brassicae]
MAISKDSTRVQFTLNSSKDKEREIIKFLNGCVDPKAAIKEIIFNYIVSNCEIQLPQISNIKIPQSYTKSPQVSNYSNSIDNKVSNSEDKLQQESESELELNELEELNKFIGD